MAPEGPLTMRRYTVAIDDRTFTIDVAETAFDTFEVSVEGRTYAATLTGDHDLPGVAISPQLLGPEVPSRHLDAPAGRAESPVARRASPPPQDLVPEAALRGPIDVARPVASDLSAPMPGVILEVHVAPGAVVRRGDPLLVLEAMKMRNTIRAPRDATVLAVVVGLGSHVAAGQPLVRFGAPPG
jgi:biotin carboxyl carrier protein